MIHYIYIPGFGGRFDKLRQKALQKWSNPATHVTFVPMHWRDKNETYQQKYERVVAAIALFPDDETRLVGESAGGAMALYAFLRQPHLIASLVTVCGYNYHAKGIGLSVRMRQPAFYKLIQEIDTHIGNLTLDDRRRITTLYSRQDHVVRQRYSLIKDAHQRALSTPGHFWSIASVLIRGPHKMSL